MIVVSGDEAQRLDGAVDELEERARALHRHVQRSEDQLEEVAVDQQLVGPRQLRRQPLERARVVRELVAGAEMQVREDEPARAGPALLGGLCGAAHMDGYRSDRPGDEPLVPRLAVLRRACAAGP